MNDTSTWLADRALIRIAGDDPRGFLQALVTQDVASVTSAAPQWSGLLTPQGKALFDFILWADGEAMLLDCEKAQRDALVRRLSLYRLRRAVTIEAVAGGIHWAPVGMRGAADPRLAELGRRWLSLDEGDPARGWQAHRLALGVTEGIKELGQDQTLWLECNAAELNGVSFTKGCYIGQENTARMHYRGKVNRRLVVVPLGVAGPRTRIVYPELGCMVEHRRSDALDDAYMPSWLTGALDRPGDPEPARADVHDQIP